MTTETDTGTAPPILVVIVDDHAMIRAGLEQLLNGADDIRVVGQAHDGEQALEVVKAERPD
ncbi:response regulator transcription factor, partial [Lactococcus petauri]|uniref:response regulator transcription factor n=1 Tax=Lactococcus petauri TaxID=1940789 RepID=UPI0021F16C24